MTKNPYCEKIRDNRVIKSESSLLSFKILLLGSGALVVAAGVIAYSLGYLTLSVYGAGSNNQSDASLNNNGEDDESVNLRPVITSELVLFPSKGSLYSIDPSEEDLNATRMNGLTRFPLSDLFLKKLEQFL